jgi:fatty acid desaturase
VCDAGEEVTTMKPLKAIEGVGLLVTITALSSWFTVLEFYLHPAIAAALWLLGMIWASKFFGLVQHEKLK